MSTIKIVDRWDSSRVIYECEAETLRDAIGKAVIAGANLARADLAGANLADAYLAGANLAGANLADAYLAGAYLAGANLADAYLAGAYLADAKNVPPGIQSTEPAQPYQCKPTAKTYAERAARFRELHPEVPVVERLDARILEAIESGGGALEMGAWHTCETTHCRAGWAITVAGAAGKQLEQRLGPFHAGRMIYLASTGRAPHFFASNERALEDLKARAAEQTEATKS